MFATIQLSALFPAWLIVLLAAGLLTTLAWGVTVMVRKCIPPPWVMALGVVRLAVIGLFLLALLQPVLSSNRTVQPLPELLVLIDTSASMKQSGGEGKTRLQEATAVLQNGEMSRALAQRFRPHWFHFDTIAKPIKAAGLSQLQADGAATYVGDSLLAAHEHLRALGHAPTRVLLVSDGNDLGMADPVEAARRIGLPVDVLAPTTLASPKIDRVVLADVQGARRVLLGSETHFRLTFTGPSAADKDRTFALRFVEDGKQLKELPLIMKAGQAERVFTLGHRPATTGLKHYEFQIVEKEAPSPPTGKLSVQVLDSKYDILVLEDTWRWEYKFLHRLFEDDPSFRFTALLPRGNAFVQFGSPDRRVNLVGFPQNRSELEGFDLFFLGDVNPTRWPKGLPAALAGLVTEEGKSLVVIAGPNLPALAEIPELHALLPVDLTRESGSPVGGPVDVQVRADAASSPFFFQVRDDKTERLPAFDQVYPVLRKRPAAAVLLEAVKHRNAYGNLIVMAEHTVGRGRVMFVATDTLWKWHTLSADKDGPTPYATFWQQALRTLTPERSRQGPVNVWLTPSRSRGVVGRTMEIAAEVQADQPLPQGKVQATAELPDGQRVPLAFHADPVNPRRFRAAFLPSIPGDYQLAATVQSEGRIAAEGRTTLQVDPPKGEDSDGGIDERFLERLANSTGGQRIDPSRPESWPAPADQPLPAIEEFHAVDLWNNFSLLLLLCGLLGVDWFIRLFKGFV